jgi:hypothetical protein
MLSKDEKKEHAERIRDQLMKELGQEEFKRLFEETRKNWIREVGAWPSPSQENLIFALDYSLSEQKQRKAFEQQLFFQNLILKEPRLAFAMMESTGKYTIFR